MKLTVKDMIDYGYKWIGMVPVTEEEIRTGKVSDKTFYVLYPDNTEAAINNAELKVIFYPKVYEDSIFGFERSETEIRLINKAIEEIRDIDFNIAYNDSPYDSVNSVLSVARNAWREVLHILGFTNEDIKAAVEEAEIA